jgi:CheY-like chemotaxis protein
MTDNDGFTVLYIEDNASNLHLVERILRRRPQINLLTATGGEPGLELARTHVPRLILLDLDLPDLPGVDVFDALRADSRTAAIPVVVVSADATARQIMELRAQGAADYITKPFDVRRMLDTIDSFAAPATGAA